VDAYGDANFSKLGEVAPHRSLRCPGGAEDVGDAHKSAFAQHLLDDLPALALVHGVPSPIAHK
jgi:hypothetical protein